LFRRRRPSPRLRRDGRPRLRRVMPVSAQAPAPASTETNRADELAKLRSAAAVRERCGMVYRWVAEGRSPHFTLDEGRLPTVAAYVAEVTRADYPDLRIPYHSRWRHFSVGGVDRWGELAAGLDVDAIERARIAVDLATLSVLLDSGAGDAWKYRDGERRYARSEGLAVASLAMFLAGAFSSNPRIPYRVDHIALAKVDAATLARHFQVGPNNPLIGFEGRSALLRRLGDALAKR